ncbi:GNAT family N-acetyltransferase [Dellaglioa sp. L3N]
MTVSYLRLATSEDLSAIISIIDEAKGYLKAQKINQWQGSYPEINQLEQDIKDELTYILMVGDEIAGTAALCPGIEPMYLQIKDGEWINGPEARYSAIHRVAISTKFRGQHLAGSVISYLLTVARLADYKDIRVDTNSENKGMQHVIVANDFEYKGVIRTPDSDEAERYVYQLILK